MYVQARAHLGFLKYKCRSVNLMNISILSTNQTSLSDGELTV